MRWRRRWGRGAGGFICETALVPTLCVGMHLAALRQARSPQQAHLPQQARMTQKARVPRLGSQVKPVPTLPQRRRQRIETLAQ